MLPASTVLLGILLWMGVAGQTPMAGTPPGAKAAAAFYSPDQVQQVHLTIDPGDLRRMTAALPERIQVPVSFRWRDILIDRASVQFKGNSSSNPRQAHKRSFLVKFPENRRFLGLRQVSFDNAIQFGSLFSEPIITSILRDHGMPAHRANHARLYLNGEYRGVYVNVERIDEVFLASHLPDPQGSLFKVDLGGPGSNLQYLGDRPDLYSQAFEPKNRAAKNRPDSLVDFIRRVNQTGPGEFPRVLESVFESDDFLRTTAVMLFAGAFDQLTGWNPHNYFLYHDSTRNRWRYLPWDLDVGFCETAFGKIRVLDDWHAAWPAPRTGPPNPLLERIIADPGLLKKYRAEARKILDSSFQPEKLCKVFDTMHALLRGDLKTDPFPPRRATVPDDRDYDGIIASMKDFVRKRHAAAVRQLEQPGERPRRQPGPPGLTPELAARIQQIQKRAEETRRNGGDIAPVARVMEKLGPAIEAGRMEEAESIIREATRRLDALGK